jgi:transglutaminase-like putative cysteine protease
LGYCEGDCDDIATLCCSMLKALNIPARLTAIQSEPTGEFDHVFAEAGGTTWTPVDPTVNPGTTYRCFGILSEPV